MECDGLDLILLTNATITQSCMKWSSCRMFRFSRVSSSRELPINFYEPLIYCLVF